jgi:hypothetical protein
VAKFNPFRPTVANVVVEYDSCLAEVTGRTLPRFRKEFPGGKGSKAFYARMLKENRNPRIVSATLS